MPNERPKNLLADACDRVRRLADDLSNDAAGLQSVSPRVLSDEVRREGQALIANAVQAARRLHEVLSQSK